MNKSDATLGRVTTADDTAAFRHRLRWCADEAGSLYSLAKRAGLVPNTVRRYLRNSEPSRPYLVAISRAAAVDLRWLATGEGAAPKGYLAGTVVRETNGR